MKSFRRFLLSCGATLLALAAPNSTAVATEYFVSRLGDDSRPGTARELALATVQKGVDLLLPGDILTIAPGEYPEAIKRTGLGSLEKETIIRAEISGTVILRGDQPAPRFRPVAGQRFVYEADFDFQGEVPDVNEVDTLTILNRMPDSAELEFIPGAFHHDVAARKLYVAPSDMKAADAHHYTVSVRPTHGIYLVRPRRVTIEGIGATGFSGMGLLHYSAGTLGGTWGMYLRDGKGCVIRNCHAWLNAWGIGLSSADPESGDNVFKHCAAWGNKSAFADGDMGGLTLFAARRDTIRYCTSYLNGMYGVNIYGTGGAPPQKDEGGNDPKHRSLLANNLAWGNESADIKIKTGYEYSHTAEDSVGLGNWSTTNIVRGLIGHAGGKVSEHALDSIHLQSETDLYLHSEFADPEHHDYRLQSTSRFRAPDGKHRGPFAYAANIFYVKPAGDDAADGLSMATAWKTSARAVRTLRPGETLYLEPGQYTGFELEVIGKEGAPIVIRGRGKGPVVLQGPVKLTRSSHLNVERLTFKDPVTVTNGRHIALAQCDFLGSGSSLTAAGVRDLRISHSVLTGFQQAALSARDCGEIDLRGNLFDNARGVAVQLAGEGMVRYSNYNSYHRTDRSWEVGGKRVTWDVLQKTHDQQSCELVPKFAFANGAPILENPVLFAASGPFGKPIGRYQEEPRRTVLRLVSKPTIHSVSATTANVEWNTSLPATCHLAWGETLACEQTATYNINCFGTYSLTGLKPGQRYHFQIRAIETPKDILPKTEEQAVKLADEPLSFTTLAQNAAPLTYYVAPDGDDARTGLSRSAAWRTLRHAAAKVNAGDTVLIAGGRYRERVRIRATGEEGHPITFRALPGERVDLDGNGRLLNQAFIATGKSHLRFDGFYLAGYNLFPTQSWNLLNAGEFQLHEGKDIQISRCFSDGRGGYSAPPVTAYHVSTLTISNCVNTNKFGGMYFWRCPDLLVDHSVFAAPMINSFVLRNDKKQKSAMTNCVFTDMFEKKAKLNIGLLCCDGEMESFRHRNNSYLLRCFPPEERALNGKKPSHELTEYILEPLFADPQFAGDPGVKGRPEDKSGYAPDRLMDPSLKLDFDSFFATNPELIKRGIGLQREAFKDMLSTQKAAP